MRLNRGIITPGENSSYYYVWTYLAAFVFADFAMSLTNYSSGIEMYIFFIANESSLNQKSLA
ncbi:MAG: hypothetical protein J07HQW1_01246 [Haloquadratum walsbyi J07HQW1]|jgi:hypothetical protein|uniref:Uncharacterized protein n=1 Tax=Haloquadratum walsbyi J07HQW1 TaxID=1238424 RepID=U1MN28_9EURY|nr:MAG: hypothetical protein J07HQW1_01246 [Haloquadratum walsbyi J07HQW1]